MKARHYTARLNQILELAKCSSCIRPNGKHAALIIDETRNRPLIDGYNGTAPGEPNLCGSDCCLRDSNQIPSGTQLDVGCSHAERNAINRAAACGVGTAGQTLMVTGEPCIGCARAISTAELAKVIYLKGGYSTSEGIEYLQQRNIVCTDFQSLLAH